MIPEIYWCSSSLQFFVIKFSLPFTAKTEWIVIWEPACRQAGKCLVPHLRDRPDGALLIDYVLCFMLPKYRPDGATK